MTDTATKTKMIRDQNDRLRRGDVSIPGKMIFTTGLQRLLTDNNKAPQEVILLVATYDDFSRDNDPHLEHDFGAFEFCGEKVFWKIDYYDEAILYGSNDPSNLTKTMRMLTVFLAREY